MKQRLIDSAAGGRLQVYDAAPGENGRLPVLWHHGTPNIGEPPGPLLEAADRLGLRWIGYDRPGYGGSTPQPGRTLAWAARWAVQVAEALEIDRFAVAGHSGGASHALATAAALPERVAAGVAIAALAPLDAPGLDWFAGMGEGGTETLQAAIQGREAWDRYQQAAGDAMPDFADADWETLRGPWSWFGRIAEAGMASGPGPQGDDDLAYVAPWGAATASIEAPILLVHGELDRIAPAGHARWLGEHIPGAELQLHPADGHLSVLRHAEQALEWLVSAARSRAGDV